MTPEELTALTKEVQSMTTGDLLDELTPSTLQAIRDDLAARPPQTPEELAYQSAHKEYDCALQRAAQASYTALDTQTAADLSTASDRFAVAADAAKKLFQAKYVMDKAFRLTPEYAAQVAAKAKRGAQ